jgi:hypothetical protein
MNWDYFKIIVIPVGLVTLIRVLFGLNIFENFSSVMSLNFFITVPFVLGALMIYLSKEKEKISYTYRIFFPWIGVCAFVAVTILFQIEGWACWIMITPLFLVFSSLGGLFGGYLKSKKRDKLNISLVILLPFLIAPIERSINTQKQVFKTFTSIRIHSTKEKIWSNVTSVRKIESNEKHPELTKFLGFPMPVEAVLDKKEVGGFREAIFERGLIFNETVTDYSEFNKMSFEIKANTYDIPSTTLDEHILIGGEYFDMLNGTYVLKKISENEYDLILYSNFSLNTTFNFYAGLWGKWIMKDIQNNILQVIKNRSEQ